MRLTTTRTGFFLAIIFLMFFVGCSGGGGGKNQTVSISITRSASGLVGELVTLNVTRENTPDFTLVNPPPGSGCVKSGTNAVVCTPTAAGTYTVTVTATADTTRSANATLTITAPNAEDVRIPVTITLSYPIASVDFEFTYTNGLEFKTLEKSSARLTPTVVRDDGTTCIGFFSRSGGNDFAPQDGALDAGNLVFSWSGSSGQSVTMTTAIMSEVIYDDKGEAVNVVEVPIPGTPLTVPISSSGNQGGFRIGFQ